MTVHSLALALKLSGVALKGECRYCLFDNTYLNRML